MRKVRIAQIGVNFYSHGNQIYSTVLKRSDIFELVGVCLPENERERLPHRVEALGNYTELSLDEIINDPTIEAVLIETDEIYTTKYAIISAQHGKHIHMEKPGGREVADFAKLISIVKSTGKTFHTGYMYRYNPAVRDLLQKVRAGELGDIISVEAQMNCWHPVEIRQWLNELPAGMMFFLGCHLVDLVMQLQGDPDEIYPFIRHTGTDDVDAPDFCMAVLTYKNGASFIKTTDIERGGFLRRQLVVTGTKATMEIRPLERGGEKAQVTDQRFCTSEVWGDPGIISSTEEYDRYESMMSSFAAMVRGEKQNPYTPDHELKLYKNVLRCCGIDVK